MIIRILFIFAALSGLCAVGLGAFAAHGLKPRLDPALFSTFQTAVQYQMYHSLALLMLIALQQQAPSRWLNRSGICFAFGIFLFCGSLYALALGSSPWFGPITPIGGLAFLGGWLCLAIAAWQVKLHQF
jgi:uncharacterized membrane protein YgdD (TMEM256/DUF423 family)